MLWVSANLLETIFYFALPVFFMISGATLLDYRSKYSTKTKGVKNNFIKKWLKRHLSRDREIGLFFLCKFLEIIEQEK